MAQPRQTASAALAIAGMLLSGCDSGRLTQFGDFAAAGTAYVTTFHTLTKATGTVFIAADSAFVVSARPPGIPSPAIAARLRQTVAADDATLLKYLADLQQFDAHADLLGAYFAAITQLTDGKASAATVSSLDSLVDSINGLNAQVEQIQFAGKGVKDYVGLTGGLVIAHFEVKELDRHLAKAAPVIDRGLALQQAAITVLADQLMTSLGASLQAQEVNKVLNPYVSSEPLPPSWFADREAYLRQNATLNSAQNAQSAIKTLRTDFETLVQDRNAKINWKTLLDEIAQMANYSSAAQTPSSS